MSTFDRAIAFVLKHEGGWVNNPDDPGGETKFGISKRSFPSLDIASLTREQAIEIYRGHYWFPAQCEKLPASIAIAHFDCAVHSGIQRAAMILQEAVGTPRDGVIGPATLNKVMADAVRTSEQFVALGLVRQRVRFLIRLERGQQRWAFIEGFMARCLDLAAVVSSP